LSNGQIIAPGFAVVGNDTYFGGSLTTYSGVLGGYEYNTLGLYARPKNRVSLVYGVGGVYYSSKIGSSPTEYVEFRFGESTGVDFPGFTNPHKIRFDNSNGDSFEMLQGSAKLTGAWKSTPYTASDSSPSEIVTKQDLINLGLINQ
jgi:hypothetical protein